MLKVEQATTKPCLAVIHRASLAPLVASYLVLTPTATLMTKRCASYQLEATYNPLTTGCRGTMSGSQPTSLSWGKAQTVNSLQWMPKNMQVNHIQPQKVKEDEKEEKELEGVPCSPLVSHGALRFWEYSQYPSWASRATGHRIDSSPPSGQELQLLANSPHPGAQHARSPPWSVLFFSMP